MKRVVIIGGGVSGLAAAHRLLELSHERCTPISVDVLEGSSRFGGIVKTSIREDFLLEHGPDAFISEKAAALNLTRRLGIEPRLLQTNPQHRRSFIVRHGRLLPVPEGFHLLAPSRFWPFAKSGILSWRGKARMALDLILPRSVNGTSNSDDETLAHFVTRRFGREALERVGQPMVSGIYTADPESLSLQATVPRFLEMERKHRSVIRALRRGQSAEASGARYSLFLSYDNGMQVLTDALEQKLTGAEIRLHKNTPVTLVRQTRKADSLEWAVTARDQHSFVADAICLALPAYASAELLRPLNEDLAAELNSIEYASSVTINFGFKRMDVGHPLDGFGFVVPFVERRSIMACTFSSVKFAGRAPNDQVLLRVFMGGALQPEMCELPDEELISRALTDLRELLDVKGEPTLVELAKWKRSMPQYHLGHLAKVARINRAVASLPGLTLAGNAFTGLGIPDCISSGEAAAEQILSS